MITIYQGETLAFALSASDLEGEDLKGFQVRAAMVLMPVKIQSNSFRRDCCCQPAPQPKNILTWSADVDNQTGTAAWILTTTQSASLPVGNYAIEVALLDIVSGQEIKKKTVEIIEVIPSYTI